MAVIASLHNNDVTAPEATYVSRFSYDNGEGEVKRYQSKSSANLNYCHRWLYVASLPESKNYETLQLRDNSGSKVAYVKAENDSGQFRWRGCFYDKHVASNWQSSIWTTVVTGTFSRVQYKYDRAGETWAVADETKIESGVLASPNKTPSQLHIGIINCDAVSGGDRVKEYGDKVVWRIDDWQYDPAVGLSSSIESILSNSSTMKVYRNFINNLISVLTIENTINPVRRLSAEIPTQLSINGSPSSIMRGMVSAITSELQLSRSEQWITDTWKSTDDDTWMFADSYWKSGFPSPRISCMKDMFSTIQPYLYMDNKLISTYPLSGSILAKLIVKDAILRVATNLSSTVAPQLSISNSIQYIAGLVSNIETILSLSGGTSDLKGMSSELSPYLYTLGHVGGVVTLYSNILANLLIQDTILRVATNLSSSVEAILTNTSELKKALNFSSSIETQLNLENNLKRVAGLFSTIETQLTVETYIQYIASLSSTINTILTTSMGDAGGTIGFVGLVSTIQAKLNRNLVNYNTFYSPGDIDLALEIAMLLLTSGNLTPNKE